MFEDISHIMLGGGGLLPACNKVIDGMLLNII